MQKWKVCHHLPNLNLLQTCTKLILSMLVAKKVTVAIDFYSILFHTMQDIGYLQLFSYPHSSKYLPNIFKQRRKKSNRSETTWGWDDTNVIFSWSTPLTLINHDCDCHILYLLSVWTEKWLLTGNRCLGQGSGVWQMHWCVRPRLWHAFLNHSCANSFYLLRGRKTLLSSIFVFVVSKWCKCTHTCYTL